MKVKIALYFLILALFNSCDRVKPNEPFYCKINGEKFRPDTDNSPIGGIGSSPLRVSFDKENGWFYISARKKPQEIILSIRINLNEVLTAKRYDFSMTTENSNGAFYYDYLALPSAREKLISKSGHVTITKKDEFLVWGTFEFICTSAKTGKEYKITDGQFNNLSYY